MKNFHYQPAKHNDFWLPTALYRRIVYTVRDYDRLKTCHEELLCESAPPPDGLPKAGKAGDPTFYIAYRREKLAEKLNAVDGAIQKIPVEYRRAVLAHVKYDQPYPQTADRSTWHRWQARFLYAVAENLGEV